MPKTEISIGIGDDDKPGGFVAWLFRVLGFFAVVALLVALTVAYDANIASCKRDGFDSIDECYGFRDGRR